MVDTTVAELYIIMYHFRIVSSRHVNNCIVDLLGSYNNNVFGTNHINGYSQICFHGASGVKRWPEY
jgi:hypothetical protein